MHWYATPTSKIYQESTHSRGKNPNLWNFCNNYRYTRREGSWIGALHSCDCVHACLVLPRAYILLWRRGHTTSTTIEIFQCYYLERVLAQGYVAIFSNTEKFRCLYGYYGCCMPSSPKEYVSPWSYLLWLMFMAIVQGFGGLIH